MSNAIDHVWQRVVVPLSEQHVEASEGVRTATLQFTAPTLTLPDDRPVHIHATYRVRIDGSSGIEDIVESDGGLLGVAYPDDASPVLAADPEACLGELTNRWVELAGERLLLWLRGVLGASDVWPAGLYDAGMRQLLEAEAVPLTRPVPGFDWDGDRPREVARKVRQVPPVEGEAWALEVGRWRWALRDDPSTWGTSALVLRAPSGDEVPVVLDDQIELAQGPGTPEPTLRPLLRWLAAAGEAAGVQDAQVVLFRDRYRLFEPLDWATDPGIVCQEPFEPPDLARRSVDGVARFLREVLGVSVDT